MERPETQPRPEPRQHATTGPTDEERDTADVVREEGEELRHEAAREAHAVAATAGEQASLVAHEAASHARDLAEDAKQQLHRQATSQTEQLGGALGQLGDRAHALADGRPEDAGPVGEYVDRIADQVDDLANRIQQRGFDGMVDDIQRFARRRPGAFLAGAALAGFAVSRLGRGVQAVQEDEGSGQGHQGEQAALPSAAAGAPPLVTAPPPTVAAPNVSPAPGVPPTPGAPQAGLSGEPLFEESPSDGAIDDPTVPADVEPPPPTATPDPLRSGQVRP